MGEVIDLDERRLDAGFRCRICDKCFEQLLSVRASHWPLCAEDRQMEPSNLERRTEFVCATCYWGFRAPVSFPESASTRMMVGGRIAMALALFAWAACSEIPPDSTRISRESIERPIVGANSRNWRAAYDLRASDQEVLIYLRIQLVPTGDVSQPQVDKKRAEWEIGIEQIWSDRFGISVDGRVLPIRLEVSFRTRNPHHTVIVRSTAPNIDQLNWSRTATSQIVAHEVGHMLGAFDEYRGGGTDPSEPIIDPSSIMSSRPSNGRAFARHYQPIRDWFSLRLGREDVSLIPLANP